LMRSKPSHQGMVHHNLPGLIGWSTVNRMADLVRGADNLIQDET
jgi:hypothetical protein